MSFLSTKPRGGRTIALLSGIGIGAAAMYVLDPQGGGRRRAIARDKALSLANRTGKVMGAKSRDLGNRAKGVAAEVRSAIGKDAPGGNGAKTSRAGGAAGAGKGSIDLEEDGGL